MKYTSITTTQGSGIGLERSCRQCGARVEEVGHDHFPHDPTFCPHCGHKFDRIQSSYTSDEIVSILNRVTVNKTQAKAK